MSDKQINIIKTIPEKSSENAINSENNTSQNIKEDTPIKPSCYEFKDEPIQLVLSSNGLLETTTEAINILTGLKNE